MHKLLPVLCVWVYVYMCVHTHTHTHTHTPRKTNRIIALVPPSPRILKRFKLFSVPPLPRPPSLPPRSRNRLPLPQSTTLCRQATNDELLKRAQEAVAQNRGDEAQELYLRALRRDPSLVGSFCNECVYVHTHTHACAHTHTHKHAHCLHMSCQVQACISSARTQISLKPPFPPRAHARSLSRTREHRCDVGFSDAPPLYAL